MTSEPLERISLPFWVWVSAKTKSAPTDTFMAANVPTFPFTLPTRGAEPPCVSHVYPEKVNSLGPTTAEELPLPDDPVLEVPLPEDPVAAPLPDDPALEVP